MSLHIANMGVSCLYSRKSICVNEVKSNAMDSGKRCQDAVDELEQINRS